MAQGGGPSPLPSPLLPIDPMEPLLPPPLDPLLPPSPQNAWKPSFFVSSSQLSAQPAGPTKLDQKSSQLIGCLSQDMAQGGGPSPLPPLLPIDPMEPLLPPSPQKSRKPSFFVAHRMPVARHGTRWWTF